MKIITNDAAYVQLNDIIHLNQSDLPIPASIFTKVYGDGVFYVGDDNRYEFIKFDEESEIEQFIKNGIPNLFECDLDTQTNIVDLFINKIIVKISSTLKIS